MSQVQVLPLALIPESAPFSSEQRAWLNGFLAGWMGLAEGATGHEGPPGTPLALTNGGASAVAGSGSTSVVEEAEEFPWHDPAIPLDERLDLAENRSLSRQLMAAMAQLDCGSCGYLCQTYAEKIASGEESSLTLCSPGGKETSKKLKELVKLGAGASATEKGTAAASEASLTTSPLSTPGGSSTRDPSPGSVSPPNEWNRQNPYMAIISGVRNLNLPSSDKYTSHIEIDLGDSGLTYKVGDALGIWPTNCIELVEETLRRLKVSGAEKITVGGSMLSLREAFRLRCCLTDVTEELLECLAGASNPDDSEALQRCVEDDSAIRGCDVLDVLRIYPSACPSPQAFVSSLALLRPRLYSISSSLAANPGQVHLTVGRVSWESNGRSRKGVASTMFADRILPGERVGIFVHHSTTFTVPSQLDRDLIMVGPGTGIAPFRAFLQERRVTSATGRNWLFFGDRFASSDFLYQEELSAFHQQGVLQRLDTAFSRDSNAKVYVQDRMREQGAELWRWIEGGAQFCVCGDARRMAADVDRALGDIIADHGGMSPEQARAYVAKMNQDGRYVRDVY